MKKLLSTFILFSLNSFATKPSTIKIYPLELNSTIINTVDEKFLSFGLDTAQIVGSFWWDPEGKMVGGRGKNKTSPLDLTNKTLINHVKELSPAYLRIGGSEADALYYNMKDNSERRPNSYDSTLTKKRWEEIEGFTQKTGTKLFFTLNQGPSSWNKSGKWKTENLEELLKYISSRKIETPFFELGNEVFAYWAIFGVSYHISEEDYAKNYLDAKKLFSKHKIKTKLAGPASAFWPIIGEPLGFLFNEMEDLFPILKNNYDIITWHYYPTQSFRCPVAIRRMKKDRLTDPSVLDEIKKWAKVLIKDKKKYSPDSELWLGETGSAQCGGEPKISNKFISSLWWLDQLGILAQLEHKVVIRHNLTGADYALLNNDHTPRPDYYSSWLWKKFMGNTVLSSHIDHKKLRTYTHCHPDGKHISTLVINLDKVGYYIGHNLTKKTEVTRITTSDLFSEDYLVNNGKILSLKDLKNYQANIENSQKIILQKHSLNFLKWKDKTGVCKKK